MTVIVKPQLLPSNRVNVLNKEPQKHGGRLFDETAISESAISHGSGGRHTVSKKDKAIKASHGTIMSRLNACGNKLLRLLGIRKKNITQQNISDVLRIGISHYKENNVSVNIDKNAVLKQLQEIETIGGDYFKSSQGKSDCTRLKLLKILNRSTLVILTKEELTKIKYNATDFINLLKNAGADPIEIGTAMKSAGFTSSEIAIGMKRARFTLSEIGTAMKRAEFTSSEIAIGMKRAGATLIEIVIGMSGAGFTSSEIAIGMKSAGATPIEISIWMNSVGFTPIEIVIGMKSAELTSSEIVIGMNSIGIGFTPSEIAIWIKSAGFTSSEIAIGMKSAGFTSSEIAIGMKSAGFSRKEIGAAITSIVTSTPKSSEPDKKVETRPGSKKFIPRGRNLEEDSKPLRSFSEVLNDGKHSLDFSTLSAQEQKMRIANLRLALPNTEENWFINFDNDTDLERNGPGRREGNSAAQSLLQTESKPQSWTMDQRKLLRTARSYLRWAAVKNDQIQAGKIISDGNLGRGNAISKNAKEIRNNKNLKLVALEMAAMHLGFSNIDSDVQQFFLTCEL